MKNIITIIAILLVGAGVYYFLNQRDVPAESTGIEAEITTGTEETIDNGIAVGEPAVREFVVDGSAFKFAPNAMTVNEGDTVRITFQNRQGTHDLVIDEFDARTKIIKVGESEVIEFVANKKGVFEYYCSVGTHRQQGMVGTLTVE